MLSGISDTAKLINSTIFNFSQLVYYLQVNGLSLCNNELLASCADDGSLRVWAIHDREQALQFQVKDQVKLFLPFLNLICLVFVMTILE